MPLFSQDLTQQAAATTAAAPVPALHTGLAGDDVLAASKALTAEATVPGMVRPFLPHQAAGYLYAKGALARWGGAFLGQDMGLGKTQIIDVLIADALAARPGYAICIAPPVALAGYQSDLAAAFPHLRLAHLKGRTPTDPPPADIYFISDDSLTLKAWLCPHLDAQGHLVPSPLATGCSILSRDEVHRDKGNQGKPNSRGKVMLAVTAALRDRGIPIVVASGTLLSNRPCEAYIPLQLVGGKALVKAVTPGATSPSGFLFRYCNPEHNGFGYNFNGVSLDRMAELHEYLRRTVYGRIEKDDLQDGTLPHGGWIVTPMALNGVMARYNRIEREFLALVEEEKGVEAMWRAHRAEAITRMQALWAEAGVAKARAAVDYITDLVDQGHKVIAFYHHQDVYDALLDGLLKENVEVVAINGSTTGDRRRDAQDAIQNGTAQVCLAQIKAAGMAVTLTGASQAVFVQVPWSAGDLAQAAGRIRRSDAISADRAAKGERVTWHVLQACKDNGDPTFDAAMWAVLEGKAKVVDAVNAGREITLPQSSIMQQAMEAWFPTAGRP